MTYKYLLTAVAVAAAMATAAGTAEAQGRQRREPSVRRAVPRAWAPPPVVHVRPRVVRPQIVRVVPYPSYGPRHSARLYYRYPSYGYGRHYGPGYGYAPGYYGFAPGHQYGGVRIDLPQRDAQVYVGGYYVGIVNEFDGVFQQLNLEPGPHRIEVRADGYEPIAFDIRVQPGRTITYRAAMRPLYP